MSSCLAGCCLLLVVFITLEALIKLFVVFSGSMIRSTQSAICAHHSRTPSGTLYLPLSHCPLIACSCLQLQHQLGAAARSQIRCQLHADSRSASLSFSCIILVVVALTCLNVPAVSFRRSTSIIIAFSCSDCSF